MSQQRRIVRGLQRHGNVIRLPTPEKGTETHVILERWLISSIAKVAEDHRVRATPVDVLRALCRVTAFSSVAQGAPDEEVLDAIRTFMVREREAMSQILDEPEPPNGAG
jgi:hypothetical protein